jgi:hypothetical protein
MPPTYLPVSSPTVLTWLLLLLAGPSCSNSTTNSDTTTPTTDGGSGGSSPDGGSAGSANGYVWAFSATSVGFDCNDSFDSIVAKNPPRVTFGSSTILVGYEQISANDQDPIVARYDNGNKVFCEHSKKGGGVDGRAYGLTWDGGPNLYVVYTIVGGGTLFDTAAKGGWLSSYGNGGASAKVSVIGAVDTQFGVVTRATFVASKLTKNGQLATNTLTPADAVHVGVDGNLEFFGTPAYCTLNPDQSSMCTPGSTDYPKGYRARFTPDMKTMVCASATGVSIVKQPCP